MKNNKNKKIILSGGGTGGSVIPLIFIREELKNNFDFLFVGTYRGVEKNIVLSEGMKYKAIFSGKLRRYFSVYNFIDLFKIFIAFWQSLFLLIKERPGLIISAGGFVSVPLVFASWFLKIPVLIHQQDVVPGLANKLMAPFSKIVTVTFEKSLKSYGKKGRLIGNIAADLGLLGITKNDIFKKYHLKDDLPLLLVLGGGTGSYFINNLLKLSLKELSLLTNIVHISGRSDRGFEIEENVDNYLRFEFLKHKDLIELMYISDLLVSRCGLATLTEISFLKKPSILIPMPDSHQEYNAWEFKNKEAAIILEEKNLSPTLLVKEIKEVLSNNYLREKLSNNVSEVIKNGNQRMIAIVESFFEN
ncbi:MAG: glycosyltransferase [Patescibacteria group bacterium]|nr:glycosyltransferase [Patescibacteria group bacterium]